MQKIRAKKSLGQNFLIDEEALRDIARSIEIWGKHIIEVGPGYGALTEYILAHHPSTLDMVELDGDMVQILDERFMGEEIAPTIVWEDGALVKTTPIALHHTDVLHFTPPYEDYSVIANIPYYITSPILFHFLYPKAPLWRPSALRLRLEEGEEPKAKGSSVSKTWEQNPSARTSPLPFQGEFRSPQEMAIMMQEEVWEKILAGRNKKPHHSYLSLAMELASSDIEIVRYVGRESFDPAPKVDSIVLKFSVGNNRDREMEERLLSLWRVAFTHPRKTLMSNLKWAYSIEDIKKWMAECGYDEKIRAEAVGMEEWRNLYFALD